MPENVTGFQPTGNINKSLIDLTYFDMLPRRSPTFPREEPILWWDGTGLCLYAKRLERGRFIWPSSADGVVTISSAQLGYLLEGIDWRLPQHTWRPQAAG
jgi:transposase